MGPPHQSPFSLRSRYLTASVTSENFVTMPKSADTHIQNTAPGPPKMIAPVTPAMLPVPTSSPSITGPQTKPLTAVLIFINCSIHFSFLKITFRKTFDEFLSYLREYQIGRPLSTGQVSFFVVRTWQIIHSA